MVVNFASVDYTEQPTLILKNAGCTPIGVLGYAIHVTPDIKYNEVSSLEFELPAYVDGEAVPFYKDVIGMRVIEVVGLGQFILTSPTETGDGVTLKKTCKAYSLEYEFSYKKISLVKETFKFWDSTNPENTLLGIIMEYMPSWHVGSVSNSLLNKYRTFEVNNENVYNFIKNTVQESYNCIFDFNTMNRTVNVRSVSDEANSRSVFISLGNLATQVEITEETEDIITRIDVNGADGINIRDVNPTGTNKIINLTYFMTTSNFSQELIDKYTAWQQLCANKAQDYYTLSVRYALAVTQKVAEESKLTDLKGEKSTLENTLGANLSAQAQGMATQERIDEINAQIAAKQAEIDAQQTVINNVKTQMEDIMTELTAIKNQCSYDRYFTASERLEMDKYMKDGDISESSFVAEPNGSYSSGGTGSSIAGKQIHILNSVVTATTDAAGRNIYTAKGGNMTFGDSIVAELISAVLENKNGELVVTAYLNNGQKGDDKFEGACVTVTGTASSAECTHDETTLLCTVSTGYMYFTQDVSEFQKRSVAWDLFEFGQENLAKLCVPTYTFSVSSANFFALDDFITFRDQLRLGEKAYIELPDETVLEPICIGATFTYDDPNSLTLQFSDSYVSGNSQFRLVDLLEESVSAGKNVELSKYAYSAFKDSGADTEIRQYMDSALDLSKQAILSSEDQAISLDQSGLRLRKYLNNSRTDYEDEQIWMNNNSILMTSDGWAHAAMAIGKFHDENAGDCWGIVADRVMGTLLAGSSLIIESAKRDGNTAVFRMDGDGCRLYNSEFMVSRTIGGNIVSLISINPSTGIVIGKQNSVTRNNDGSYSIDTSKADFYADTDGTLHLSGNVYAKELHIGELTAEQYIRNTSSITFTQPAMPSSGYQKGDYWRDSDSPYGYLYVAVNDPSGTPANDWAIVSSNIVEGAKIDMDTNAGTIDILAASSLNLSGGVLNIAGTNALNLSSTGGVNITGSDVNINGRAIHLNASGGANGIITLGSNANVLRSTGVLSLANGNIVLDGPNNTATFGGGNGTVNIGTSGTATINLATFQVKSSTATASYTTQYSSAGSSSSAQQSQSISYTATNDEGGTNNLSFSVTHNYTKVGVTATNLPSITNGNLIQIVKSDRGLNIYADASAAKTIITPSTTSGNLLGWDVINATTIGATNLSASKVVGSEMYVKDGNDYIAVANQKWVIQAIGSILSTDEVIPAIKARADAAYYKAYHHYHLVEDDGKGTITIGGVTGKAQSFNIADTSFFKSAVSAVKVDSSIISDSMRPMLSTDGKTISFVVDITLTNKQKSYPSFSLDVSAAYDKGVQSVNTSTYYANGWVAGYNAAATVSGRTDDSVTVPTRTGTMYDTPTRTYTANYTPSQHSYTPSSDSYTASDFYMSGVGQPHYTPSTHSYTRETHSYTASSFSWS